MRTLSYVLALSVSVIALSSAANAQVRGMHKHDASIAANNYNVPIVTGEAPGSTNLKVDLDGGNDSVVGTPNMLGGSSTAPVMNTASVSPLAVGTQAPDFTLQRAAGGTLSLKEILGYGPALIMFNGGTSSSYSLRYLQLMQKNLEQFRTLGVNVVALTSEPLEILQAGQQRYNFGFNILQDNNNQIAKAYGVVQGYQALPSLFSVDASGKIAAIQLQQNPNMVFDLKQATDALRTPVQAAISAAPQAAVAPQPVQPAPAQPVKVAKAKAPASVLKSSVADAPAPIAAEEPAMAPIMPAVPSGQAQQQLKPIDPRISYDVPPSSPEFNKNKQTPNKAI